MAVSGTIRRRLLQGLPIAGAVWSKPIVHAVVLPPTAELSPTADCTTLLGAPQNLSVCATPTGLRLDWGAPTNSGDRAINSYLIERQTYGDSDFSMLTTNTANSYTDTTAMMNTAYRYRVMAIDACGIGEATQVQIYHGSASGTPPPHHHYGYNISPACHVIIAWCRPVVRCPGTSRA